MISFAATWLANIFTNFSPIFAAPAECAKKGFLGLPNWWEYLPDAAFKADGVGGCLIDLKFDGADGPNVLIPIGLAVLDGLLRVAGVVAVIFVIVAGFNFITAAGSPDKAASARQQAINALIGAAIAISAAAIVQFVGGRIAG